MHRIKILKHIISILLILFVFSSLYAGTWNVGVDAGYVLGLYDQRGGERETRTFSPGHAFEISVPVEYRVNNLFSITSGIRYIGKAYGIENIPVDTEEPDIKTSNIKTRNVEHFFEVPLTVRLSVGNDFIRGYLGGGGYIGVRFLSTEMGFADLTVASNLMYFNNFWNVINLNTVSDNLFDAGIIAEGGFTYSFNSRSELYLSARYQYSLTMLDNNYQYERVFRYIDTFSVTAGVLFEIGGAK